MMSINAGPSVSSLLDALPSSHAHQIRKPYVTPTFNGMYGPGNSEGSSSRSGVSDYSRRNVNHATAQSHDETSGLTRNFQGLKVSDNPVIQHIGDTTGSSASTDNKGKGKADTTFPKTYYPVSYIRGEWMQQLLALDIGKRKIRYFLSDETLCLGTPLAPVASPFRSGMTFYEACTPEEGTSKPRMYMSEEQVSWLVDELYSNLGVKNSKLVFQDVDVDKSIAVPLSSFAQIRRVRFQNNVAAFRQRCGIALFNHASLKVDKKESKLTAPTHHSQGWTGGPKNAKVAQPNAVSAQGSVNHASTVPAPSYPTPAMTKDTSEASVAPSSSGTSSTNSSLRTFTGDLSAASLPPSASLPTSASSTLPTPSSSTAPPTSFTSLTKAERQARLQAKREAALQAHLREQRAVLPAQRRLYKNIQKFGGAALACDVESWTEDAEVLLELGMAWMFWLPQENRITDRDGGCCHYIIEETIQYRNEEIEATRWDYTFGESQTLRQTDVSAKLREKMAELSKYGPLILVFHDASAETRYFQKLGIDPNNYLVSAPQELTWTHPTWPSKASDIFIIHDTQNLYAGWSDPQVKQINLGKACTTFGLISEAEKLHNAGNDAFATLRLWELLLDMKEYDIQQEGVSGDLAPPAPQVQVAEEAVRRNAEISDAQDPPRPTLPEFEDLIQLW